jgi:hypothetical protein
MIFQLIGVIFLWSNLFSVVKCQCSQCPQTTTTTFPITITPQCTCVDTSSNCASFKAYCSILNMQDSNPCRCTCGKKINHFLSVLKEVYPVTLSALFMDKIKRIFVIVFKHLYSPVVIIINCSK